MILYDFCLLPELSLTVSRPVCLGISTHLGLTTRSLLLSDSCGFVRRVCRLELLLALASAVILGSEPRGTRDHILLSQIWDFPFCRLLRLAGLRWRYSTPPPNGIVACIHESTAFYITARRPA
jgi:hypothetical protein